MRKLCDSVDRFCLQHPRFGIPNLMKFLVGIMAVVFVLDLFSNGYASYMLYFNAELVLQGELWRLVTWMFLPTNGSLFWIFISLSFYYFIGTSIEEYWGTAKFTLFYLACAVLMVVFGGRRYPWNDNWESPCIFRRRRPLNRPRFFRSWEWPAPTRSVSSAAPTGTSCSGI
ncbi:Rhomboid family [uncultured Blautia sp.]|nr:Rhomboid family [uncultured Blautia sp.]